MKSGIYSITNAVNGHRYIGSAVDLKKRQGEHRYHLLRGTHHSGHLQRAWNKYGESAFEFEILDEWEPEFLISMEQWWINMLAPEYNICRVAGSNRGTKATEETRRKHSEAAKGNQHWLGRKPTAEHRLHNSDAHRGHPVSEETRRKISEAKMGRRLTEETCRKMSNSRTGKKRPPFTEVHRRHMSEARKGRHPSAETRIRISESLKNKGWPLRRRRRDGIE